MYTIKLAILICNPYFSDDFVLFCSCNIINLSAGLFALIKIDLMISHQTSGRLKTSSTNAATFVSLDTCSSKNGCCNNCS